MTRFSRATFVAHSGTHQSVGPAVALVALLALAPTVAAQTPTICMTVDEAANPVVIKDGNGGELYGIKVAPSGGYTDWLMDATEKGGPLIGMGPASVVDNTYQIASNWTVPEAGGHAITCIATFPDGSLQVGSGPAAIGVNFVGATLVLPVGSSPDATDVVSLPSGGGAYQVDMGSGPTDFPAATSLGINVVFAPHPEVNGVDRGGFTWSGVDPQEDPQNPGFGIIRGYNLYRMAAATQPSRAEIGQPRNFAYHFDLTTFELTVADGGVVSNDLVQDGDLAGLQNPDGSAYSGDERLLFQDTPLNPDRSPRFPATPAPVTDGTTHWYAIQPVVRGTVDDFAAATIAGTMTSDWRIDVDGDGTFDAVDFGGDGTDGPEFLSPQADFGLPGLGLTNGGLPLLSHVLEAATTNLPAAGNVGLRAQLRDGSVALTLSTDLEDARLLGYDVFRVRGSSRERVNDGLIVAAGGTGNVYEVVDAGAGGPSRRLRSRAGRTGSVPAGVTYEVDVLHVDGTQGRTWGPFAVELGGSDPANRDDDTPRRARRRR